MENKIKLFENRVVRSHWDAEQEEWYFSVVDVIEVLTESKDAKQYLKKMRSRDLELNSNWGTICTLVKMVGKDGKLREIQAANTAGILRLIQSIPSPKAEPFKLWLAQVGSERLDEIADPEKAILRGADFYRAKGYTENWINQRLQTIEMRKELTDEWKARGIDKEKDYKELKGLKKENLRDNMTNIELVLNMLAEVTTTAISKSKEPETFSENLQVAKEGGSVAKNARVDIEERIGKSVISPLNAEDKTLLDVKDVKGIEEK